MEVSCVSSSYFIIMFFSISLFADLSTSTFISACPVDFENKNYTIITSQCKGPNYQPKPCCDSLKEFACPYTDELDDLSNSCSDTMFSYITTKGNYPAGLFSSFCREGKEGLDCSSYTQPDSAKDASGSNTWNQFQLLMLTACLVVSFFVF